MKFDNEKIKRTKTYLKQHYFYNPVSSLPRILLRLKELKFRIFYQENMTLEEPTRHRPPVGSAPDTEVVQEILTRMYQVEIS